MTSDPTLTGQITDDGSLDSLNVQFDHNGDAAVDGFTLTTLGGQFTYTPAGLAYGPVTVRARAGEWDAATGEFAYGQWKSFSFTLEPAVPPLVQVMQLVNDDGQSNSDLVTSDPLLFGLVANDGSVSGLDVEFDQDGDGIPEGTSVTGSDGAFTFNPIGISAGPVTIRARASEWDVATQGFIAGDWAAFSFTFEQPSLAPPVVSELKLLNDTGESDVDAVTTDPSLVGTAAYDGDLFGITIEFDHNGDDMVEGTTTTDYHGRFTYQPFAVPAGPVTIRARAGVWDLVQNSQRFGEWTSVSFTLEAAGGAVQGPQIEGLRLQRDTGDSTTDRITTDPTVTGSVADAGAINLVLVEFDHDADGAVDGSTRSDSQGNFSYRPAGVVAGEVTIGARAVREPTGNAAPVPGQWSLLSFTLLAQATNSPPVVTGLRLVADTGVSDSDGITADPTLTGTVTNDGDVFQLLVEFDHDGDGAADGAASTDAEGKFTYVPEGLANGPKTIRARAREWDAGQGAYVWGQWASVSFTLDTSANLPPEVTNLDLFRDTLDSETDHVTTDPRVTGKVSNDGGPQGVLVEFDHDSDGVPDGSAYTNPSGDFWYLPNQLATGESTIRARGRELLYGQATFTYGPWASVAFTLVDDPNNALPQVTELVLVHDTGTSATDAITGDPRVEGVVSDDGSLLNLLVEFDHNGDGVSEGREYADLEGEFAYRPAALLDERRKRCQEEEKEEKAKEEKVSKEEKEKEEKVSGTFSDKGS